MIYQYAFSIFVVCVFLFFIASVFQSPFPRIFNWADKLGILCLIVGWSSLLVGSVCGIWNV